MNECVNLLNRRRSSSPSKYCVNDLRQLRILNMKLIVHLNQGDLTSKNRRKINTLDYLIHWSVDSDPVPNCKYKLRNEMELP